MILAASAFEILSGKTDERLNTYGRRALSVAGPQSGNLSLISSGTRPSVQTVSYVCLKRTHSLDNSAFSALEVLDDNCALEVYLLTYLLTYGENRTPAIAVGADNNPIHLARRRWWSVPRKITQHISPVQTRCVGPLGLVKPEVVYGRLGNIVSDKVWRYTHRQAGQLIDAE